MAGNIVALEEFPDDLPEFIDDPEEYLPTNMPEADLILAVGLSGDINLITPIIAHKTGAKSIIVPIHDPQQLPPGLQHEVEQASKGLKIVFPRPFCTLQPMGDPYIDEFVEKFGKPELDFDAERFVKKIKVLRGAPCGSTWFIAKKLEGLPADEAELEAGNKFHNYPCLASMKEDNQVGDTLMHIAGYQIKETVKRNLGYAQRSAVVDQETCEGDECDHQCHTHCPQVRIDLDTVSFNEEGKAVIDPATCGVCGICVDECPYGSIEIEDGPIDIRKEEGN
jgi:NAD-dependent dihydropyrimidine dehydrogenase PreA subunit